jgi:hypothetical protein
MLFPLEWLKNRPRRVIMSDCVVPIVSVCLSLSTARYSCCKHFSMLCNINWYYWYHCFAKLKNTSSRLDLYRLWKSLTLKWLLLLINWKADTKGLIQSHCWSESCIVILNLYIFLVISLVQYLVTFGCPWMSLVGSMSFDSDLLSGIQQSHTKVYFILRVLLSTITYTSNEKQGV